MPPLPLTIRGSNRKTADGPPVTRTQFKKLLAKNPNYFGNFPEAGFDPIEVISGNTSFEEVTCIGYFQPLNLLQATVAVKLPTGYGGTLCQQGSEEYIRFYVNYGDAAGWQDLGLSAFNVHDIPNADDCLKDSEKPLYYAVTRPWTPNSAEQKICLSPVLPVIRGIASWNVPPPANSPSWTPVWGNVIDQNVQIKPRPFFLLDLINLIPKDELSKLPSDVTNAPNTSITLPGSKGAGSWDAGKYLWKRCQGI